MEKLTIKQAWDALDSNGKIVLVVAFAAIVIAAMYFGYVTEVLNFFTPIWGDPGTIPPTATPISPLPTPT